MMPCERMLVWKPARPKEMQARRAERRRRSQFLVLSCFLLPHSKEYERAACRVSVTHVLLCSLILSVGFMDTLPGGFEDLIHTGGNAGPLLRVTIKLALPGINLYLNTIR